MDSGKDPGSVEALIWPDALTRKLPEGSFSTFSTFSNELVVLLQRADYGTAALYLVLSLLAGVSAIVLGMLVINGGQG